MSFFGVYPGPGGSGGGGGTGFTKNGLATLVNGTVTVSNASVSAMSQFFLTCQVVGGIQGVLSIGTVIAGTSFVINSTSEDDDSTISWGFI